MSLLLLLRSICALVRRCLRRTAELTSWMSIKRGNSSYGPQFMDVCQILRRLPKTLRLLAWKWCAQRKSSSRRQFLPKDLRQPHHQCSCHHCNDRKALVSIPCAAWMPLALRPKQTNICWATRKHEKETRKWFPSGSALYLLDPHASSTVCPKCTAGLICQKHLCTSAIA